MKILLNQTFQKEVRALSPTIKIRILKIIDRVVQAESLADIPNIKAMEGSKNFFRIRLGDYRIGFFKHSDNTIEFQKVGPRGSFYNRFP